MDEGIEGQEGASPEEPVSPPDAPSAFRESSALAPLADGLVPSPSSSSTQLGAECAEALPAAEHPHRRKLAHGRALAATVVTVLVAAAGALVVVAGERHPALPPEGARGKAAPVYTTSEIARLVIPAVVDVNTVNQTASGFVFSAATGMIVTSSGYIVTNNHVVEDATSIRVSLDGYPASYPAVFVGADPAADVAVIRVAGLRPLPVVHFGNSVPLKLDMPLVAIGNALGRGGRPSVTTGELEAMGRSIVAGDELTSEPERLHDLLETSALIRSGNSGGPLVDGYAQVVGMDTAASENGREGFALPIKEVAGIATDIETGQFAPGIVLGLPAFLGIVGQAAVPEGNTTGVPVSRVVTGEPAARAGIRPGDVIVGFDGRTTPNVAALRRLVRAEHPGALVRVRFVCPTGLRSVSLRLAAGPAP